MKLKTIIHKAEEGGYWAEIPAIPGCERMGRFLRSGSRCSIRRRTIRWGNTHQQPSREKLIPKVEELKNQM